jgi:hypothetical protein
LRARRKEQRDDYGAAACALDVWIVAAGAFIVRHERAGATAKGCHECPVIIQQSARPMDIVRGKAVTVEVADLIVCEQPSC